MKQSKRKENKTENETENAEPAAKARAVARRSDAHIRELVQIALFAALIAVCSWIVVPVPAPGVPFTLQVFAVCMALRVLGGRKGTLCVAVYLLMGAVGAPVFSSFRGGIGALVGVTGGYLVGFAVMGLVYWLFEVVIPCDRYWANAGKLFLSLLSCYLFGTVWYMIFYAGSGHPVGFGAALMLCVVPYLLPDALKILLALKIADMLQKRSMKIGKGR